ncbi:MAG: adenylate/guanylate cyclase domain-containing protein [Acidimicrobiia bacterium]
MRTSKAVDHALELGRTGIGISAWGEAYEALKAVERDLPPEGLMYLSHAAWWIARLDEAFAASEAAYHGFVAAGDDYAAGRQAVELFREYAAAGQSAVAAAWRAKAGRHLEGAEDCAEEGLLLYLAAGESFNAGNWDQGREVLERTIDIGERYGDTSLVARARMLQGMIEVEAGNVERGMGLLGEAAASVTAGVVDPETAAVVMCNTIGTCWDMADFRSAAEWTDNARRWFERNDVPGYPGICRVRRAEIMTLSGDWDQAEAELHQAMDELERYDVVVYIAEANYALGEIYLARGDVDGALAYFKEANELGREPLPGFALVAAARGERDAAIVTLKRALTQPGERMQRSRVLLPLVDLLIEAGDLEEAVRTTSELESLAAECKTGAMRAWAETARAACLVAEGSTTDAVVLLDTADRIWEDLKVPYEVASTRLRRAVLRRSLGDHTGAELDLDAARAIFERLGAKPDLERLDRVSSAETPSGPEPRAVMVTDIVGSTRLVEAMGDAAWAKLLAWHDRTLVHIIEKHHGETIDRTGDGYLATFVDSPTAVSCAIDIQRALDRQRTDQGFAPSVRIGIHAAAITNVDGSPAGAEVHRATRIGALAAADEILISRQVTEALGPSIRVEGWRSEQVKGFDNPVEVGTLSWSSGS